MNFNLTPESFRISETKLGILKNFNFNCIIEQELDKFPN